MKLPGYNILKEVTKRREMTLGEVCEMLPRRHDDHRDFYDLASLYTGRLIETSIQRECCNWNTEKTSLVAEELFTMSKGKGTFKVDGMPEFTNDVDYRQQCKVFCTANADLMFEQNRQKRMERIWALAVGIFVAVVSVMGAAYLQGNI